MNPPLFVPLSLDNTSDFTVRNAQSLAVAAHMAYSDSPTIQGVLTDTRAVFFDAGSAYVLAFRGTADFKDWITDAKFLQKAYLYGGLAHDGFLDATYDLIKSVADTVQFALAYKSKPLFIAGHSLGGALAIVTASLLYHKGIIPLAVYTYGSPRVGNGSFAMAYDALGISTYRLVCPNDIVPHVPLPGLILQYRQTREEAYVLGQVNGIPNIQFGRSGLQKAWADALMVYRAWLLIRNPLGLWDDVKGNHAIENYLNKLS